MANMRGMTKGSHLCLNMIVRNVIVLARDPGELSAYWKGRTISGEFILSPEQWRVLRNDLSKHLGSHDRIRQMEWKTTKPPCAGSDGRD
jgi:hypothetical protein